MNRTGWTSVNLPSRFGQNRFFPDAEFLARDDPSGGVRIRTTESYNAASRSFISAEQFSAPGGPSRLDDLAQLQDIVQSGVLSQPMEARLSEDGGFVAMCAKAQLALMTADAGNSLAQVASRELESLQSLGGTELGKEHPFRNAGVAVMRRRHSLVLRLRLPAILLRLQQDPDLAKARGSDQEGMIFGASHHLYSGIFTFSPYIGPLQCSLSPYVWCLSAPRSFGAMLIPLGVAVRGTEGLPRGLLDVVHIERPEGAKPAVLDYGSSDDFGAIDWWASALNDLFLVLSDPVVFASDDGHYNPSAHLNAILTVEQLFRRVTSLLVGWRDSGARRVLLYTILDTLHGLTGVDFARMCTFSYSERTLRKIQQELPPGIHEILLPSARAGVQALKGVQDGFSSAVFENGSPLRIAGKSYSSEEAAGMYLYQLRNATHGYGGKASESEARETLLAIHSGKVGSELPLLAYLYLLDLLINPDRLRRILKRRSA